MSAATLQPAAIVSPFCASPLCHLKLIQTQPTPQSHLKLNQKSKTAQCRKRFFWKSFKIPTQCMHSRPCLKQLVEIQGIVLGEHNYLKDLINPALFPQGNRVPCHQRQIGSTSRIRCAKYPSRRRLTGSGLKLQIYWIYLLYFFPPRVGCFFL